MAQVLNRTPLEYLADSGADIITDPVQRDYFRYDIYDSGADLLAVVRPHDTQQLAAAIGAATAQGLVVIPRGGGMSYTGGYAAPQAGAVLFDLSAMNRILNIDQIDMTVTVEAGCTWASLYEALKPLGLRTPFWGTLSGLKATIGGGMSQNCLFWGSGRYGTGADSCISLEVVLADGTVMSTGSTVMRPYGPDLTGLFLCDTGAMAMKATITLRLIPEAKAHGYASFTFETHSDLLNAASAIERAGLATECFGFDPSLNAIRMKRDSLSSDAKALGQMMKSQSSLWGALKEGAKVVTAGRDFLKDAKFSLHVLSEGRIQAAADADIAGARKIVATYDGIETENTIPKIIRANPFGPLNSMLGPNGERWAPIHGLLPHSRAIACYDAINALFAEHRTAMDAHGIYEGTLIAAVGGAGMIIEPCLYWPDVHHPVHQATIETAHYKKLPIHDHNPETWALVEMLKQKLVDLFYAHQATHTQIARTYRYRDSLDPVADNVLQAVKQAVDPRNLMNPGSLGL